MNLPQGFLICSDLSTFCTHLCSTPPSSDQNGPLWCCSFPAQNTLLHSDTSHSYFIPNTDNNKHGAKGLPSLYPKLPPPFFSRQKRQRGCSWPLPGFGSTFCPGGSGGSVPVTELRGMLPVHLELWVPIPASLLSRPCLRPHPGPAASRGHPGHRLCWPRRAGTLTGEATLSLRQRAKLRGGFVSG